MFLFHLVYLRGSRLWLSYISDSIIVFAVHGRSVRCLVRSLYIAGVFCRLILELVLAGLV